MMTKRLLACCLFATGMLLALAGCSSDSSSEDVTVLQDTAADDSTTDLVEQDMTPPEDVAPDNQTTDVAEDLAEDLAEDHMGEIPCAPDCTGKVCGDDGCNGTCGECEFGEVCNQGICEQEICVPDCSWKQCGNDGCDGSCGECEGDFYCGPAFQCIPFDCTPDCFDKACGDDGCDGSCGECGENEECVAGACESTLPDATCGETVYCLADCIAADGDLATCLDHCYPLATPEAVNAAEAYGDCVWTNCDGVLDGDAVKMGCALSNCKEWLDACVPPVWGTGFCSDARTCMDACNFPLYEKCLLECMPTASFAAMQTYMDLAICTQVQCSCVKNDSACNATCIVDTCSEASVTCDQDGQTL